MSLHSGPRTYPRASHFYSPPQKDFAINPTVKHLAILLFVCGLVFFTNLGSAKLWDRDEPRNAGCAAEMLERADWVVPMFNNELRPQKPVLLYWLMISAYSVFGVTEFAARFWSALLGTGTVLCTYFIGRRLFGSTVGLLAGIALATSVMFDLAARAATPDSLLIFCSTAAIAVYVLFVFEKEGAGLKPKSCFIESRFGFVLFFFILGLAVLAKGPVGFVLPIAIVGMFMLSARREETDSQKTGLLLALQRTGQTIHPLHFLKTLTSMRPLIGVAIVLLVAAPWYVLVGLKTNGDFLQQFFLDENLARATTTKENHSGGIWYYPMAILAGCFPWSVFALPVGMFVASQRKHEHFLRFAFLLCWVGVQVGLFSLASTKLPSYVTPCYPAVAILIAVSLNHFIHLKKPTIIYQWAGITLGLIGIGIGLGLYWAAEKYLPGEQYLGLLGLIPLAAGLAFWTLTRFQKNRLACISFCVGAVLFSTGIFGWTTKIANQHRDDERVVKLPSDFDYKLATFGTLESSWIYYADQQIFELETRGQSALDTDSQTLDRADFWEKKPRVTPEFFVAQHPHTMILTTKEKSKALLRRLPDFSPIASSRYFLNDESLILVAPNAFANSNEAATTRLSSHSNSEWIR